MVGTSRLYGDSAATSELSVQKMPMKRRFMLFVVVVASACGGTTSAPTYVTRHISGVVLTEDGRPVPGATVFIGSPPVIGSSPSAPTDGNGFYQLAFAGAWQLREGHPRLYDDTVNITVPWAPQPDWSNEELSVVSICDDGRAVRTFPAHLGQFTGWGQL
jgi:hypothetical protein